MIVGQGGWSVGRALPVASQPVDDEADLFRGEQRHALLGHPAEAWHSVVRARRGDTVALGHVVAAHPQLVVMRTALGATRVIPFPRGEEVPRIC